MIVMIYLFDICEKTIKFIVDFVGLLIRSFTIIVVIWWFTGVFIFNFNLITKFLKWITNLF